MKNGMILWLFGILVYLGIQNCAKEAASGPDSEETEAKGKISGKVVGPDGKGVPGVTVVEKTERGYVGITDDLGNFIISGVLKGDYNLLVSRFGYLNKTVSVKVLKGQDVKLPDNVVLSSAFCSIKGRVTGEQGGAKPGVTVGIPNQSVFTLTDAGGNFTLKNVSPEAVSVVAALGGTGWGEASVSLSPGDALTGVNITLESTGGSITGTIRNTDGTSIKKRTVVTALGGGITDTSDADGNFMLTGIPAGQPINIEAEGNATAAGLIVDKNSQLAGVDISAQGSFGSGSVKTSDAVFIVPDTGSVIITPDVRLSGGSLSDSVSLFLWDLDNDGKYETSTAVPSVLVPGAQNGQTVPYAVITVSGDTVKGAEVNIQRVSSSPVVSLGASVSIAPRAQAVLLGQAICKTGGIILYQWDFDGDGVYDWKRSDVGTVQYRYFREGVFYAKFKVTASGGLVDSGTIKITVTGLPAAVPADEILPPEIIEPQPGITVSRTFDLTWADVGAASYAIYFGTVSPPGDLLASGITDTTYRVTGLNPSSDYFFQVVAYAAADSGTSLSLAVQTAMNNPPLLSVDSFQPLDSAVVGGDSVLLRWTGLDPDGDNLSYLVYFSMEFPPSELAEISADSIRVAPSVGGWVDGFDYYWQITASDGVDTASSRVFSFQHDSTLAP